jgi:hypothetical protein
MTLGRRHADNCATPLRLPLSIGQAKRVSASGDAPWRSSTTWPRGTYLPLLAVKGLPTAPQAPWLWVMVSGSHLVADDAGAEERRVRRAMGAERHAVEALVTSSG